MEQIAMDVRLQVEAPQAAGMAQAGTDTGEGLGGVFALLLQQLAGDAENNLTEALFPGQMCGQDEEQDDTQLLLGMELMADALNVSPMLELLVKEQQMPLDESVLSGAHEILPKAELYSAWGKGAQKEEAPFMEMEWGEMLETLTNAWKTGEGGKNESENVDLTMGEMKFQTAVWQARETLSGKPRGEQRELDGQGLDLEALQAAVNNRQFLSEATAAKQESPSVHEISEQLKTGILDNISKGKNEFSIKLKPEGLGEITVKFLEVKNEISLRIVTSSTAVGKMIADEVANLQSALRPLHAQVQEIVTVADTAQTGMAQSTLTDNQGGQFAWHYQQEANQGGNHRNDDFDDLVELASIPDEGLNVLV